jgi:cell division protein FtsQ
MRARAKQPARAGWLDFLQLWGLALVIVVGVIATASWTLNRLQDPAVMPVRFVEVEGKVRHLDLQRLQQVVYQAEDGNFFTVTLDKVRAEVERLPWVDRVSIRRVWPDTLRVRVVEQQPLARWGKEALVNLRGEIFRPSPMPDFAGLTLLEGEARDAAEICRTYEKMQTLLGTSGLKLARVRVDARQAWRLWTRGGVELNLGRKQMMYRLTRFVRLYPKLSAEPGVRLATVDLRYANGFAASWEALPELQTKGYDPEAEGIASRLAGI